MGKIYSTKNEYLNKMSKKSLIIKPILSTGFKYSNLQDKNTERVWLIEKHKKYYLNDMSKNTVVIFSLAKDLLIFHHCPHTNANIDVEIMRRFNKIISSES